MILKFIFYCVIFIPEITADPCQDYTECFSCVRDSSCLYSEKKVNRKRECIQKGKFNYLEVKYSWRTERDCNRLQKWLDDSEAMRTENNSVVTQSTPLFVNDADRSGHILNETIGMDKYVSTTSHPLPSSQGLIKGTIGLPASQSENLLSEELLKPPPTTIPTHSFFKSNNTKVSTQPNPISLPSPRMEEVTQPPTPTQNPMSYLEESDYIKEQVPPTSSTTPNMQSIIPIPARINQEVDASESTTIKSPSTSRDVEQLHSRTTIIPTPTIITELKNESTSDLVYDGEKLQILNPGIPDSVSFPLLPQPYPARTTMNVTCHTWKKGDPFIQLEIASCRLLRATLQYNIQDYPEFHYFLLSNPLLNNPYRCVELKAQKKTCN